MRTPLGILVCLLLLLGPAAADEKKPAPKPKPLTDEQAADAVLAAVKSKDEKALKALAENDKPDPWRVAEELCYRGEHDAAESFAKSAPRKAVEKLPAYVARRRGGKPDEEAHAALAEINAMLGKKAWQKALDAAAGLTGPPDSTVRIRVAFGRGLALRSLRRMDEAIAAFHAAGEAGRALGWLAGAKTCFREATTCAFDVQNWRGAIESASRELEAVRELADEAGIASALNNIGRAWYGLGDHAQALEAANEVLEISRRRADHAQTANALHNIGIMKRRQGKFLEALAHYREALEIDGMLANKAGMAITLNTIGVVHRGIGQYPEALDYYEQSLRIAREIDSAIDVGSALGNMGVMQERLGNFSRALALQAEALEVFRKLDDKWEISKVLTNFGTIHSALGASDESLRYHGESLAIATALEDKAGMAGSLLNIGIALSQQGEPREASKKYLAALEIFREQDWKAGIAAIATNLGNTSRELGEFEEALAHYDTALSLYRKIGDEESVANTLVGVAHVHERLSDYETALATYQEARDVARDSPQSLLWALIEWGLADMLLARGENAGALDAARQGVLHVMKSFARLAESEGAHGREGFADLFDTGYRAALRAGDGEDLFWFLEQGRAGSLRESLNSRAGLEAAVIPANLRRELALKRAIELHAYDTYRRAKRTKQRGARKVAQAARKAYQGARADVERVEARIQREAKAAAALALPRPEGLDALRARLAPDEALVLLGLTSNEAFALVVRRHGARVVRLGASKRIESAVAALLDDAAMPVSPNHVPALRKLLTDPLSLPEDLKRVLVSPMGRLGYVPYTLLLPSHEIVYVHSGATYGLLLEEKATRGRRILGLGDPDYKRRLTRLARLPATKKEIEAIADLRLLDTQATETGLQAVVGREERWRAVHFACHGRIDPERPMLSELALTPDAENDGSLTALEIFRMKIPADLVVMSACDTGKGKIYKTEGIVGLTRAFMFAGAPRVICSLWKVDDEATQALMIKFYELWNPRAKPGDPERPQGVAGAEPKGLGAAAALKQAQAFVRDHPDHPKWKHPYYWAAWVLWGLPD